MVNQQPHQVGRYEAKADDLKKGVANPPLPGAVVKVSQMSNHRYKGYPGEFMQSPRKPVTMSELMHYGQNSAGTVKELPQAPPPAQMIHQAPPQQQPMKETPRQPASVSAELRQRKESAERSIALFKHEKLAELKREQEIIMQERNREMQPPPQKAPFTQQPNQSATHTQQAPPLQPATRQSAHNPYYNIPQKGDSAVDRAINTTQRRIEQLETEMTMMNTNPYIDTKEAPFGNRIPAGPGKSFDFYDPWGKGQGNPRRIDNGNTERYRHIKDVGIVPTSPLTKSWTSPQTLASLPAGVRTQEPFPPHWSDNVTFSEPEPQMPMMLSQSLEAQPGTGLITESKFGGAGEAVKTTSGHKRTRYPTTMRKDIYGNPTMTEMDGYNPFKGKGPNDITYDPFGKPGNGAPLRGKDGRMMPQRHKVDFAHELDSSADIHKRKRAADDYLHELKREMVEQKRTRDEATVEAKAPIGELATILSRGLVGNPRRDPDTGVLLNQHHSTSDISKARLGKPAIRKHAGVVGPDDPAEVATAAKQYHTELSKLAEDRYRMRQLERMRDNQEELQHGENWNHFWGKPGGGAPNQREMTDFRKPNMDVALHHNENRSGLVFVKNTPAGIQQLSPRHYQKSTIASNANNMFELPNNASRNKNLAKDNYKVKAPFATIG